MGRNPTKTRTIAGREVTLESGFRYVATRPMAGERFETYTVTIRGTGSQYWATFGTFGMTYDEANEFIAAFNNGPTSWDGREW